jgi:hypothetical protein
MSDKPIVALFKGLQAAIDEELPGLKIERRYMPYVNGKDLEEMKVSLFMETTEDGKLGRSDVDTQRITFGIAVQQLVDTPRDTDDDGNPVMDGVDSLSHSDKLMNEVEILKDLWRTGGALRERNIAGFAFNEMVHDPVYEPLHLMTIGVLTAIIDVTYELIED